MSVNDLLGLRPAEGPFPTSLVVRCEAALSAPLKDLDAGQICLLINQDAGREYVLPLAIDILRENPLVEASNYRGDLLAACLRLDPAFWADHRDMWVDLFQILEELKSTIDDLKPDWDHFVGFLGTGNGEFVE